MSETVERVDPEGFRRPILVNDWGVDGYYLCAVREGGVWGKQDDLQRLRAGELVVVRWPNGERTTEMIRGRERGVSVGDHGHVYSTTTVDLYVQTKVRGIDVEVPLERLWVKREQP